MNRRRYLAALATGSLALAGCQGFGGAGGTGDRTDADTPTTAAGTGAPGRATARPVGDVDLPVPRSELRRGAARDAIPAITDPAFAADWSDLATRSEPYEDQLSTGLSLLDDDRVVGIERDGRARAYPLRVLNWHEVVNDEFGGPLLVTYCPLCGSAVTAERRVDGAVTTFGVSGLLYRSDLVLYDEATDSLWSQLLATAIRGPRTGETLTLVPSSFTTWASWRDAHPDTTVLLPPPVSDTVAGRVRRRYAVDPYAGYANSERIGVSYDAEPPDGPLHPKTQVVGVTADGEARAYPLPAVEEAGVVNDTVGGRPVVVAATGDGTLHAYVRRVDGRTLTFEAADGDAISAGGSRWSLPTGEALDGPFAGTRLRSASDRSQMFWFAWAAFEPATSVFGVGGTPAE